MKKAISVILAVIMITCMVPVRFPASAEEYVEGYYTYEVIDNEVSIISVNTGISTAVEIPSSLGGYPVTSIGWSAFDGCTKITSIYIPASVTLISNEAFTGCTGLTGFIVDENNPVYTNKQNCLIEKGTKELVAGCKNSVIPSDGSVTSIGYGAFYGCSGLTSVVIPECVTSIEWSAFQDCTRLKDISVHNGITYFGGDAFYNTAYYNDSDNWVDGVLYIGNYLVETDGYTPSVYSIREGTVAILDSAFAWCEDITSITIPNTVKRIGYESFCGCTGLTSITIPGSVTSIDWSAFQDCTKLENISLHDNITYIGGDAFYNTAYYNNSGNWIDGVLYISKHLVGTNGSVPATYAIREGTLLISDSAFSYNETLTTVTLPDSVKYIGWSAFEGCPNLTTATIGNGVTSIDDCVFYDCPKLTNVNIGNSVKSIGVSAFSDCVGLKTVTIPNSVTTIGENAFYYCIGLESINLTNSVTKIGSSAFDYCEVLTDVYYDGYEAEWAAVYIDEYNDALKNANIHCKVVEPDIIYGDVIVDGVITAEDALQVLLVTVKKISFTAEQTEVGDVDGDGEISANDALLILQHSIKKISKFPVEE